MNRQVGKMARWRNGKLTKWQFDEMASRQVVAERIFKTEPMLKWCHETKFRKNLKSHYSMMTFNGKTRTTAFRKTFYDNITIILKTGVH
jgi:hypothetical protein